MVRAVVCGKQTTAHLPFYLKNRLRQISAKFNSCDHYPQMLSCAKQAKLRNRMIEATKVFSELIGVWTAKIGMLSRQDYDRLAGEVGIARQDMDNARTALESHLKEHGC